MWTREDSIETTASRAAVWRVLADVEGWKAWNAGIESIELHGPFQAGTRFTMRPPGQDALISLLVDVRPERGFTDETVVEGHRVLVMHELLPLANGNTQITYRTEINGPRAAEFGPMVASDFPQVLAALKSLVEARLNSGA